MVPKDQASIVVNAIAVSTNVKQTATLADLFKMTVKAPQKATDCPVSSYKICSDKDCKNTLATHSHLSLTSTKYEIDTTKSLKKTTLYIGATTTGGSVSLGVKKVDVLVCGYEAVLPATTGTTEVADSRTFEDGEFKYELTKNFTTDGGTDCPITSIALFKDKEGKTAFKDDAIKFDTKYVLTVTPPAAGATLVFYVVASSKGNVKYTIKDTLNLAA
jgi:hypothetical protein